MYEFVATAVEVYAEDGVLTVHFDDGAELLPHGLEHQRTELGRERLAVQFADTAGYDKEAVLRDYYRDGDDLVIFRKRLSEAT
jgi:hypothetical protein